MEKKTDEETNREKALLIGIQGPKDLPTEVATLLNELKALTETLGIEVVSKKQVHVRKYTAAFLMGSGKAQEIRELAESLKCGLIIFDNELSPSQQKNWEELVKVPVIDRQEVILDIFAKRAQTKEAVLQVQLARAEYELPRLTGAWTHLSRQRGGSSMQRGVGETQIESDRRLVRDRIARLKRELSEVTQHREVQRKRRMKIPLPTAAIVGYTNAGKSSLLNALTGSEILAEDKLFATLDPTTRRLELGQGQVLLVTDTVGFVRRLPHRLVEAFKATLEEAVVADFLIHVADLSSPDIEHHMATTLNVMRELGADKKPVITVFNKSDLQDNPVIKSVLKSRHPKSTFISTKTGEGLDNLLDLLKEELKESVSLVNLLIPHTRYDLINELYEIGAVEEERHEEEGTYIKGRIPKKFFPHIENYKI